MRCLIAILIAVFMLDAPAAAATPAKIEFTSRETVLVWIYRYRAKPDPARVPAAVRALGQMGALREPESSGVFIGFFAGVIGSNPAQAEELVAKMFPLPPEDQWAIVRAIAYSCLPEWKALLAKFAERMPTRQVMIDRYLEGKLPTLNQVAEERSAQSAREAALQVGSQGGRARADARAARHGVGLLFRHRGLQPGRPHHQHAALVEGPQQRRQAHARQHGEIYARQQRIA